MSTNVSVCDMSQEVIDLLKKFKLRKEKNVAAIVLKIDKASLKIVLDEEYDFSISFCGSLIHTANFEVLKNISISELQDELPPQQPRYVCLSYVLKHADGRVSYPLVFIFISPQGCSPEQQMMYAGSKTKAVKDGDFTKVIELRSLDDLTEETILDKLK